MPTKLASETFATYSARNREQFNHAREITQPYKEIEPILEWCKCELKSDWRWQLVEVSSPSAPGRYIFYFDDNKDYFAFTLKWG